MTQPLQPDAKNNPERAAREKRLANALRDNLRRRKDQARAQQRRAAALSKKEEGGDGEPPA
jgi:hypothetical protein